MRLRSYAFKKNLVENMIYFSVVIIEDQKDEKNRTYTFLILNQVEKSKFKIIAL